MIIESFDAIAANFDDWRLNFFNRESLNLTLSMFPPH